MDQINDLNTPILPGEALRLGNGIPSSQLSKHPGRPKNTYSPSTKHASSLSKSFKRAGLDWRIDFAEAIKHNRRERIRLWLRLLPYLVTTGQRARVKKWKGKASKAALVALDALEGK